MADQKQDLEPAGDRVCSTCGGKQFRIIDGFTVQCVKCGRHIPRQFEGLKFELRLPGIWLRGNGDVAGVW